jgi:AcrR family transcriptional regulator
MTERPSLRAEQVAQTRQALIDAARELFGKRGYAATSVDDVARAARVTSGALYHHFATKTGLFEAVFEHVHGEMLEAAEARALASPDPIQMLTSAIDGFLDAMLDPAYQRIIVIDAPAVLGVSRYTELDERHAFQPFLETVQAAGLRTREPEVLSRLIFGMLTRAGMLIAASPQPRRARNAASTALHEMIEAFAGELH